MVRVAKEVSSLVLRTRTAESYDRTSFDRSSAIMARHTAGANCNRLISLNLISDSHHSSFINNNTIND